MARFASLGMTQALSRLARLSALRWVAREHQETPPLSQTDRLEPAPSAYGGRQGARTAWMEKENDTTSD